MPRLIIILRTIAVLSVLLLAGTAHAATPVFEPPVTLAASATTDDPGRSDHSPAFATDGAGTWVVAWSSDDSLSGTIGSDTDILFARSTDGGLSFTAQAPLNGDAATDIITYPGIGSFPDQDRNPRLAADATGRFIAVWQSNTLSSDAIMLARSDDGGASWSAPAVLFDDGEYPVITTDGAGTWIIAWQYPTHPGYDSDVYFTRSTDGGLTWTPPAALNTTAAVDTLYDRRPQLFWSGGVWVAAWTTGGGYADPLRDDDLLYARSVDGGATWSAPAALNTTAASDSASDSGPQLAGDGTGNWVAVWQSGADPQGVHREILFARSLDGATTWSAPQPLDPTAMTTQGRDTEPAIAAGNPGTYVAVWSHGLDAGPLGTDFDVLTATSTDGALTWSAPQPVNTTAAGDGSSINDWEARIAYAGGYWLAFWISNNSDIANGRKGYDYDVVMALGDHPCGNGVVDAGEECDDGPRADGDCCSRSCRLDAPGAACTGSAECLVGQCDGAGTCNDQPAPLGTLCTPDSDLCTFDRCDGGGACQHVAEPRLGCRVSPPRKSALQISPDKLVWKWTRGATTVQDFNGPHDRTDYALCLFDGASVLLARADAPASGTCGVDAKPCWTPNAKGFMYRDQDGTPNGVATLKLRSSVGLATLKLLAQGPHLGAPTLPVASLPVRAQLVNADGICWEGIFSAGVRQNASDRFSAKSD